MADTSPAFIGIDQLLTDLKTDAATPGFRLAIVVSGGGARGAYEAGAAEALMRRLRAARAPRPQVVAGTSAGSLVGGALWLDLFAPRRTRARYVNTQSDLWRDLADGNDGARKVLDPPELIEFATHRRPLPHVSLKLVAQSVDNALTPLTSAIADLLNPLDELATLADDVRTAVAGIEMQARTALSTSQVEAAFSTLEGDVTDVLSGVGNIESTLSGMLGNVLAAFDPTRTDVHLVDVPGFVQGAVDDVTLAVTNMPDVGAHAVAAGVALDQFIKNAAGLLVAAADAAAGVLAKQVKALTDALAALPGLVANFKNVFATLETAVSEARVALDFAIPFVDIFIDDTPGTFRLSENAVDNSKLIKLLANFAAQAMKRAGLSPVSGKTTGEVIMDEWVRRNAAQPGTQAELYLTGANLSVARELLFAVADATPVTHMAQDDSWMVDLTSKVPRSQAPRRILYPKLAHGDNVLDLDPWVKAVITSTSIPGVFAPQRWKLERELGPGQTEVFQHVVVDGGLINNTPIDVAVAAGATHVISLELQPLGIVGEFDNDTGRYAISTGLGRSFGVAMDGSLAKSIGGVVATNRAVAAQTSPKRLVQLYRLAPGMDDTESPGVVDFDGKWDDNSKLVMSLYDWFMQGYVDVLGSFDRSDSVVADYLRTGKSLGCAMATRATSTSGFWRATEQALP